MAGFGNPTWRNTHPKSDVTAPAVQVGGLVVHAALTALPAGQHRAAAPGVCALCPVWPALETLTASQQHGSHFRKVHAKACTLHMLLRAAPFVATWPCWWCHTRSAQNVLPRSRLSRSEYVVHPYSFLEAFVDSHLQHEAHNLAVCENTPLL